MMYAPVFCAQKADASFKLASRSSQHHPHTQRSWLSAKTASTPTYFLHVHHLFFSSRLFWLTKQTTFRLSDSSRQNEVPIYCDEEGERASCGHFNYWPLAVLCPNCSTWHANDCSLGQRSCPICQQPIHEDNCHSECFADGHCPSKQQVS